MLWNSYTLVSKTKFGHHVSSSNLTFWGAECLKFFSDSRCASGYAYVFIHLLSWTNPQPFWACKNHFMKYTWYRICHFQLFKCSREINILLLKVGVLNRHSFLNASPAELNRASLFRSHADKQNVANTELASSSQRKNTEVLLILVRQLVFYGSLKWTYKINILFS